MGFRERNEPEILIELVGLLIFSVDYDRRGSDLAAHCERSFQCIDQEQLSNTLPLVGEIACKPPKERSTYSFVPRQIQSINRLWRKIFRCNVVLSERIEARYPAVLGREHINNTGPPFNILRCLLLQVSV